MLTSVRSEQVMYVKKPFGKIGGACLYHPPPNTFGTSGHIKRYQESLLGHNSSMYPGEDPGSRMSEKYQFLVSTTHLEDEVGLLCVRKKVYVGNSPVGPVILVNRTTIMKGGLVRNGMMRTSVYVVQMIGTVIADMKEPLDEVVNLLIKRLEVLGPPQIIAVRDGLLVKLNAATLTGKTLTRIPSM